MSSHELSITRRIAAPPERVWQVMTDRMAEWWCPKPWRAEVDRLDRKAGGVTQITMYSPDGEVERMPGLILAWDEGRRFAFTDAIHDDLEPAGPFMIGIFSIEPEEGGTRYRAAARHWTQEDMERHKAMGFEEGWAAVADQLAALCEEG